MRQLQFPVKVVLSGYTGLPLLYYRHPEDQILHLMRPTNPPYASGPALMAVRSRAPPLTACYLSPILPGFESSLQPYLYVSLSGACPDGLVV